VFLINYPKKVHGLKHRDGSVPILTSMVRDSDYPSTNRFFTTAFGELRRRKQNGNGVYVQRTLPPRPKTLLMEISDEMADGIAAGQRIALKNKSAESYMLDSGV